MSRGWVLGRGGFKKALLAESRWRCGSLKREAEAPQLREPAWQSALGDTHGYSKLRRRRDRSQIGRGSRPSQRISDHTTATNPGSPSI